MHPRVRVEVPGNLRASQRVEHPWHGLLEVVYATGGPRRAHLPTSGALLVRPDGHVGFRAVSAESPGLAAFDAHHLVKA